LPSAEFLGKLSPGLAALRGRLFDKAVPADHVAGTLTEEVAGKLGLPRVPVSVGAFDAHMGAVGSGVKPGVLAKIIGTSTCDISVALPAGVPDIPGLCGIVNGSVLPGFLGLEAGQSAVGDIFNWFVSSLCPPEYSTGDPHVNLTKAAEKLKPGESGLLALDWNNGNRCVLVDPLLSGLLVGQTLHTTAPEIYRSLVEATAFGGLAIIRRFEEYGIKIDEVVSAGGIAEKNPFVMQVLADVCDRPMKLARSGQTCALGSAIFGAVVGGAYKDVLTAQAAMTGVKDLVYKPIPANVAVYARLYKLYMMLHDAFGTPGFSESLYAVMKELIAIRREARG
jgi:L-ribulokinase